MSDPRYAGNDDPAQDPAEGRRDDAYTEPEGQNAQTDTEVRQGVDRSQADANGEQQDR